MALDGTYTGLQASIAGWLKRSDLTSIIPDLIVLAESRIARDLRHRNQITVATVNTTAGVPTIPLPADFLELQNIDLVSTTTRSLTFETQEQLDVRFPAGQGLAKPAAYTIVGSNIELGPIPDTEYPITLTYYARIPSLSVTPTNWLLTSYPAIYLFAALSEAEPYLFNDNRALMWEAKYQKDMTDLQNADDTAMFSGTALRVRSIV